jgi:hypothetical protein
MANGGFHKKISEIWTPIPKKINPEILVDIATTDRDHCVAYDEYHQIIQLTPSCIAGIGATINPDRWIHVSFVLLCKDIYNDLSFRDFIKTRHLVILIDTRLIKDYMMGKYYLTLAKDFTIKKSCL